MAPGGCECLLVLRASLLAWRTTRRGAQGVPELRGERRCGGSSGGIEGQRCVDRGDESPREPATLGGERGRATLDRARHLLDRNAPERMAVAEGLPEQHADGPDVALRRGLASVESLRRDVGQRSRDVADGGEGVGAVELRETEVEQLHGELVAILEEDVRRLHVPVDDPGAVGVRERVEDLSGDLDGVARRRSRPQRIASRKVLPGTYS